MRSRPDNRDIKGEVNISFQYEYGKRFLLCLCLAFRVNCPNIYFQIKVNVLLVKFHFCESVSRNLKLFNIESNIDLVETGYNLYWKYALN